MGTAGQTKEGTRPARLWKRKKIGAAKHKEPMQARAGGLCPSMWPHLRPAETGNIKVYAISVLVALVCLLSRRGYDVRHRGRSGTPEGNIARSFPAVRLYIFKQKDGLPERTGKMGFPPKGAPPLELTFSP